MGNLTSIRNSVLSLRGCQNSLNSLRRSIRLNTDQIDDVDHEHGHLVGQVLDLQKAVDVLKNDSTAIKKELTKKDLAMDEIEKFAKRKKLVLSRVGEELGENIYYKVTTILQSICGTFHQKDIDCAYRLGTPSTAILGKSWWSFFLNTHLLSCFSLSYWLPAFVLILFFTRNGSGTTPDGWGETSLWRILRFSA